MSKPYLSLILALYNEGPTLEQSIKEIYKTLQKIKKSWEVIFVEDRSTDNTLATIQKLLPNLKNSKLIQHRKNQGRGKTISDGIKAANGEITGFFDIDLEISANYLPFFIKEIEKGYDVVVGDRFYKEDITAIARLISSKGYKLIIRILLNLPIKDTETGYKFFRRKKILTVLPKVKDNGWFWDTEICARAYWAGLKVKQIPVLFRRRTDKKSTVKLISDTLDYLRNIYSFRKEIPSNLLKHQEK